MKSDRKYVPLNMAGNSVIHRFVLGAAALAQPYGIANPQSSLSPTEMEDVLAAAWSLGIRLIDTAPAYGDAELRIGNWSKRTGNRFRTISKLPAMQNIPNGQIKQTVQTHLDRTCRNLHIERLDGYLLHNPNDFARPHVREALMELQVKEKFRYCGLSVYTPKEAVSALTFSRVGAFQIPINVFDNRLSKSGFAKNCADNNINLFLRSVFLQGLIFRDPNTLSSYFRPILPKLRAFRSLSEEARVPPSHLALSYVLKTVRTGQVIVGCRHASHIEELRDIMESTAINDGIIDRLKKLGDGMDNAMIDPRLWPHPS